jgi:hypothetical protein
MKILDLRIQKVTTLDLLTDVIGVLCEPAEVLDLKKYFMLLLSQTFRMLKIDMESLGADIFIV